MQLHNLKPNTASRKKKRIGRGGKRGTYSGRGQKGQSARSGHNIPSPSHELIMRIPKLRGVKNKPVRPKSIIINVGDLERVVQGNLVNHQELIKKGIIANRHEPVKILGGGIVKKSFEVHGLKVSASARVKIESAGGKISA
ncbi:50S ribosomal protein L15 [Candidatus Jorgensenbacteria bacterium]|nr:50S ribosomal protein L15 [Candidatus Jorgensenbacteria bacterium]